MNNLFASVESLPAARTVYTFARPTAAGESLVVEFSRCESSNTCGDCARLWYKHGYTSRILPTYWVVSTYATDAYNNCRGRYNPTIGADGKLDFAWVLEANEENRVKLLNEIMRRAGIIVTREDWAAAGTLEKAMQPGDYVAAEIVDELRDCLPPAWNTRDLFQLGEPYSHREDPETGKCRATYTTFVRDEIGWYYCGHCFAGRREEVSAHA